MTAETSSGVAIVGAYREKGGISARVGIGGKVGIGVSFNKDAFRPSRVFFLLHGVLSIVYSGGVGK